MIKTLVFSLALLIPTLSHAGVQPISHPSPNSGTITPAAISVSTLTVDTNTLKTSEGKVGVGTDSPGATLDVAGNAAFSGSVDVGTISVQSADSGNPNLSAASGMFRLGVASLTDLRIGTYDVSPYGNWLQTVSRSPNGSAWPLALNPLGGSVGIGTAAPESANKLQVQSTSGNVVVASSTTASGFGVFSAHGTSGGCIMLTDTDNAGWTKCKALNGTLSCATDADGICD